MIMLMQLMCIRSSQADTAFNTKKANQSNTYTKTEVDDAVSTKATESDMAITLGKKANS